jgi:hypothetical protein
MANQNQWPKTTAVAILTMASISSRAQVNVTTWHNTAIAGFTAGTGRTVSTQSILSWTYAAN